MREERRPERKTCARRRHQESELWCHCRVLTRCSFGLLVSAMGGHSSPFCRYCRARWPRYMCDACEWRGGASISAAVAWWCPVQLRTPPRAYGPRPRRFFRHPTKATARFFFSFPFPTTRHQRKCHRAAGVSAKNQPCLAAHPGACCEFSVYRGVGFARGTSLDRRGENSARPTSNFPSRIIAGA